MTESAVLRVIESGMMTTVQDLGRTGQARFGVAPGGALDRAALILGNRLLGNDPGAAALEITLTGPRLSFSMDIAIAITGGDLGPRLNHRALPLWQPVIIRAGDILSFDPAAAGAGTRAYLCVAGGVDVPFVMGSRSTEVIGAFGGWNGRPLRAGDELSIGPPGLPLAAVLRRRLAYNPPGKPGDFTARAVTGPQLDRFTGSGVHAFFESLFTVSAKSNRQGIRLNGPLIQHVRGADLISEGIAHGAVQVPGDGLPIVLLAGRQTAGGYVKIATVIGADLDRFGQLRPGDAVRFTGVSVQAARDATLAYRARLGPESVVESPRQFQGASAATTSPGISESELEQLAGNWDPDGVIRVIEALERNGVSELWLEIPGLTLKLQRGSAGWSVGSASGVAQTAVNKANDAIVTAPVLGVLYRRSTPDAPVLVEVGATVTAGQVICVLEVMKTYHEVTAPRDGLLASFLVADGQFVEYGQAIARIEPRVDAG